MAYSYRIRTKATGSEAAGSGCLKEVHLLVQLGLAKIILPSFEVKLCGMCRRPVVRIEVLGTELEVSASAEPLYSYVSS